MIGYLLAGVAVVAGVAFLLFKTKQATVQRREHLMQRSPMTISDWKGLYPDLDESDMQLVLDAIGSGLQVESSYLQPEDEFETTLARKGQFIIDDDTVEDVADAVEDSLSVKWDVTWESVGEAVVGICRVRQSFKNGS